MTDRGSWLLCDYGEVLSLPQPESDVAALVALAEVAPEDWSEVYWRQRPDYDRGVLTAAEYWAVTLGTPVTTSHLAALVEADIRSWLHPAHAALDAVARAADRGLRLALLSNAPHEVADAIDGQEWLRELSPRLFSARLGATKPDPSIYRLALDALGASATDVWFVDDRPANVAAAEVLGMHAVRYRGDPEIIDAIWAG